MNACPPAASNLHMHWQPFRLSPCRITGILFLLALAPAFANAPAGILAQLPAGMEANLIDPLTVDKRPSFAEGEHLRFKLGWSFFTVARSVLTVQPETYREEPALKISVNTRTNGFADTFYKVRNTSTSWISRDVSWSWQYSAVQKEGKHDRDIVAFFDPDALTGRYLNNLDGSERAPVNLLPGTFDPLGIVYFVRSLEFDVGDELVIPTSNGKEFFYTVVRVVDKVERKFAVGRREAWVLEPDIKDLGGVFKKSRDASLRFYLSADEFKRPLRMESEVAVGKFWAELVEVVD